LISRADAANEYTASPMSAASAAAPSRAEPKPARGGFFALEPLDNRYPALHGLRVFAILSVIQYHVTWVITTHDELPLSEHFEDASLSLFFGMDCFFVLSGFLIGSILLRSIDTTGAQNIGRFYLRRIFRTFPSYWLVLTILAFAFPVTALQREHLIYEYTYTTNFGPLGPDQIVMFWGWSLALEEQFYLAVPLLFVLLRRLPSDRARVLFLVALTVSCSIVRCIYYAIDYPWTDLHLYDMMYFRTGTRYDAIVAGILLAVIEARFGDRIAVWLRTPLHRAALAVPALACLWLLLVPDLFGEEYEQIVHLFTWGLVTSVMYLLTVPMLLHGDGWITRALSAPIWRRLATLGYGVYLVHIPLVYHVAIPMLIRFQELEIDLSFGWPLAFTVVTIGSFAIGYVLHVLVEKPSLRIREWLAA
jgi:peptidoglycan/LPS O-acetylase OafA/YrhL